MGGRDGGGTAGGCNEAQLQRCKVWKQKQSLNKNEGQMLTTRSLSCSSVPFDDSRLWSASIMNKGQSLLVFLYRHGFVWCFCFSLFRLLWGKNKKANNEVAWNRFKRLVEQCLTTERTPLVVSKSKGWPISKRNGKRGWFGRLFGGCCF